jgi:hypothetical protein
MKGSSPRLTVVVLAAALGGGLLLAWPAVFPLLGPSVVPPLSRSGLQVISQPYAANPNANAMDLIVDINTVAGAPVTYAVGRWISSIDAWASYNGTAGTAFALAPPEAYLVGVTASVPGYTIAGGVAPAFPVALAGPGPGSRSGTHHISIPDVDIPGPLPNADALLALMGPTAVQACRFVRETELYACYTGASGLPFPLTPGEGYLVQVSAPTAFAMP